MTRSQRYLWVALALFLSMAGFLALYDVNVFSNDGAQYLSVARNLLSGHGLSTSILYYEEHYRMSGAPVPQTVFPPGFPLMIATLSLLGLPMRQAAFAVNLLSFHCIALLVYDLARRNGSTPAAALTGAFLWLVCLPARGSALWLDSEMAFVLLTLLSARFIQRDTMRSTVGASVAAAASFVVRYAGVFWIGAACLWLSIEALRQRTAKAMARLVAFAALPGFTVVALFLRNYLLVGDAKGGNASAPNKPLGEVLRRLAHSVEDVSGLSLSGLADRHLGEVLLVVCLVGAVATLFRRGDRVAAAELGAVARRPFVSLATAYVVVTVVLLVYLEKTTTIGLGGRMLLPLLPFVLIVAPALLSVLEGGPRAPQWVGLIAAGSLLCGQATLLASVFEGVPRAARYAEVSDSFRYFVASGAVAAESARGPRPILTNEPNLLAEASGAMVLGLTGPPYAREVWTQDRVRELAAAKNVENLVYFRAPRDAQSAGSRGVFFDGLAAHRPQWLIPLRSGPGAGLYGVVTQSR